MAHEVKRLSKQMVFNKPHLVAPTLFQDIVDYLAERPNGMLSKEELAVARDIRERGKELNLGEGDVATIPVSGALTYEETFFGALCGMSSYQGILTQMREAVKRKYKYVVLDVDSGGGEAYGCFESARDLRKLADDNDIKLIAYVDGMSASAAYGLSVAAHEVIINPSAEAGSIGVLTRLVNDKGWQEKEGLATTYIYAGDNKIPFDEEGGWRKEFLTDLQNKVDKLYDQFVSHVATFRDMSEEAVRNTQASMYDADEALSLGLVDKVMERAEFAEYLADLVEGGGEMPLNLFKKEEKEEQMSVESDKPEAQLEVDAPQFTAEQIAEMQAKATELEEAKAKLAAYEQKEQEAKALAEKEAKEELLSQLQGYSFINESHETLGELLFGASEDLREAVLDALAKADAALEAGVSEPLTVTEEAEDKTLDAKKQEKELVRERIKAKLAARDK